ncbi:hypothetical protein BGI09_05385 [Snodgrassella alvi]|nr:hypothetical protein BGI09_05385 [Snodgrassella alvi]
MSKIIFVFFSNSIKLFCPAKAVWKEKNIKQKNINNVFFIIIKAPLLIVDLSGYDSNHFQLKHELLKLLFELKIA